LTHCGLVHLGAVTDRLKYAWWLGDLHEKWPLSSLLKVN
jgi:hypothetical protein